MTRSVARFVPLLALAFAPLGCVLWPAGAGPGASPMPLAEALARRDRGDAVLVDVRSREAYAEGHIPGALNVALNEIEGQAPAIRKMGRLPILYCG